MATSLNPSSASSPAIACFYSKRLILCCSPLSLRFSRNLSTGNRTLSVSRSRIAVARYGGRGFRPEPGSGGGGRLSNTDYDPALDLDRISSSSVRLLDEEQKMVGILSINEAVQMADDAELMLAILSADADPPVLRLFDSNDYKKYKYEQQKKKRVQLKRSAANRMDLKELKMGYNIDSHDYSVRLRSAQKFLKDGDKVKVIVNLKGRENEFRSNAIELLKRFQKDIGELAIEESKNFKDRNIFIILMPNKTALQKGQEQPKKRETPVQEVSASV